MGGKGNGKKKEEGKGRSAPFCSFSSVSFRPFPYLSFVSFYFLFFIEGVKKEEEEEENGIAISFQRKGYRTDPAIAIWGKSEGPDVGALLEPGGTQHTGGYRYARPHNPYMALVSIRIITLALISHDWRISGRNSDPHWHFSIRFMLSRFIFLTPANA